MSVIIQLQNLPLSASSIDIRDFFSGLNIPPGGVHIVGGKKGSAFIAFANDEDARQAMEKNGRRIKDSRIKLALSSHRELKEVLEQLHKEQSECEMSRKIRLSETRSERNRSHLKHRRSRSRSLERSRSHQEFNLDNQNSGGKYDESLQRENPSMRQQSPYDRHGERKVQYPENSGREFLGSSGNDKPNPYISSTYTLDTEEERNEEIRRRIETFIATFGQAENYNLDLKKETYPNKTFKTGHDGFSQPYGKEAVHHNRLQGYPPLQMPSENYPSKPFDDFDTRRHFDDLSTENTASTMEVQGITSVNSSYKPSREQNERMSYGVDGQKFPSQTNHNVLGDRLLNSPMDIEEDKNDSNIERFQPNQHFGPYMFSAPQEMSHMQGENASVPTGPPSFNLLPFQNFEHPPPDFQKGHPEFTPPDAAKDFCIKLEGLPYYATENDIRRVFRDQSIFDMFVPYTSDGKASGIGFVQFSSAEDLLAAVKMKYCMIGESRVEFLGSSRAALMEARMPSVGSAANVEISSTCQDVLALKRTQDILSSMLSSRDSVVSTPHQAVPPTYLPGAAYPVVPLSNQQQAAGPPAKRSLCAVITGLPSHFTRHIQVLKCIEETGINFYLIHLVLNNRSRFTGKVFAEFHDLRDLDAALKKHNQNVEGCTIGVKQVLYEEMTKILSSNRSRCMYPTPKQPTYREKKPEKAPYIWEPPYEAVDMPSERGFPAVWSSERAMENQRLVGPNNFSSQNKNFFKDHSEGVQVFNRDFGASNSYGPHPYAGGSSHQKTEIDLEMHNRTNRPDSGNLYSGFNEANESFQVNPDFPEMDFSQKGNQDFVSRGGRGFRSRKNDFPTAQFSRDKQRERSRSPIDYGQRKDFSGDHKSFRDERNGDENSGAVFLGSVSQTRHHSQQKNQDILVEGKDEEFRKFSNLKTDVSISVQRNSLKTKEAWNTPAKKRLGEGGTPQKSSAKTQSPDEQSLKPKHEREKLHGGKSSSDTTSPKSQKKRFKHRKKCPKRLNQDLETEVSKPHDHARADDLPRLNNRSRSHDRTRSDSYSRPIDHMRPDDRSRHDDRSRPIDHMRPDDRSRPIDHMRPDVRSRPIDHMMPDDRSRPFDHVRSDNRSRRDDHMKSDDRPRRSNRSRSGDRSRPIDVPRSDDRSRFHDRSRFDDRPRPNNHSRHRTEQKEYRKETCDYLGPEELFKNPGCVLEATNVDPHLGLYELLDFFRGYGLHSENLIRRYTDAGEPTSDLRIAFHCCEDAEQAHKILNRQCLKGRTILLSFV